MFGKGKMLIRFPGLFLVAVFCLVGGRASSESVRLNVFERFRHEMTASHSEAAPKYMSQAALAKWNTDIMPYFDKQDRQLSHYFAFSLLVPKMHNGDFYIIFFNPWVDGALLTVWRNTGQDWKMLDFYFASGERVRKQVTVQSVVSKNNIPPVWLLNKDNLLKNILSYYRYMAVRFLESDAQEYISWFSLDSTEKANDLLRVKLRMQGRIELALKHMVQDKSGAMLSGAISQLKYAALTKDKQKLVTYHKDAGLIADMRPDIIKSWRDNWYFKNKNSYTIVLTSPVEPRLFLLVGITPRGKIKNVLVGDLEGMAFLPGMMAAKTRPANPAPSSKKVQIYTNPKGERVEVTTEKRGGKVVMTTRINGKVTEILNF